MNDDVVIYILGGEQKHQTLKKDGICTCLCSSMGTGGGYIPFIIYIEKESKWKAKK